MQEVSYSPSIREKQPGISPSAGSLGMDLNVTTHLASRKAIRESLTGRILTYELLPFSVSELGGKPLNRLPLQLIHCRDFRGFNFKNGGARGLTKNSDAQKYLRNGGLPGICFIRNERERLDLLDTQLQLILDRDLRLVCDTQLPFSRLLILDQILAQHQNRPLNLTEISRKARVSFPTLRNILAGLKAIFLIRILPCEGNEVRPVLFFWDQGEAQYLASGRYDIVDDLERLRGLRMGAHHPDRNANTWGKLFEQFICMELKARSTAFS